MVRLIRPLCILLTESLALEPESGGGMCGKIEGERDEPLALTGQERRMENSTASCLPNCYLLLGKFSQSSVPCAGV